MLRARFPRPSRPAPRALAFAVAANASFLFFAARPACAADAEPAHPEAPAVEVTIDSTREGTVLERRANRVRGWTYTVPPSYSATEQWETVCVAPCRIHVDPNTVFHVGGGQVSPSNQFVLPTGPGPHVVHVHAGPQFWYTASLISIGVGLVISTFGGVVVLNAPDGPTATEARQAGLGIMGTGAVVALAGLVGWLVSDSSVEVR
jgi:hypothetical protein